MKKLIQVIALVVAIVGISSFGSGSHAFASTIHHTSHKTTFHAKKYKPLTYHHKKVHHSYVRKVSSKHHK